MDGWPLLIREQPGKKGLAYAAPGSEISTWSQMNRFLPDVIPIVDLGLLYAGSATEMLDPISIRYAAPQQVIDEPNVQQLTSSQTPGCLSLKLPDQP